MNVENYLKQLIAYNLWANTELAKVLATLDEKLLLKEITSSFSSVRKTVYHIWDAEFIWLSRIKGVSLLAFPSKEFSDSTPISKFLECSMDFNEFVIKEAPEFFDIKCNYINLQQKELTNTHAEIIMHCMNHSTYHRGQLVTMLRQLGISDLPSTDLIRYLRTLNA